MTVHSIPEGYGQPGDTYDDGKQESSAGQPTSPSTSSTTISPSSALPRQATTTYVGPEDSTSFEHCDIAINILLLRQDGHPGGRMVNIVVHNFAGIAASQDYRASELTKESLLDNIQKGVNAVVQQFLLKQADERQKKLEAETKAKQISPAPSLQVTPVPQTIPAVPAPSTSTAQPAVTSTATTTVGTPTKNAATTPAKSTTSTHKHEQYSMF